MPQILNGAEMIASLKKISDELTNLKLNSVEIEKEKRAIVYKFICDQVVAYQTKKKMEEYLKGITPKAFISVAVLVEKRASDVELVDNAIYNFLRENYPSISIFLEPSDISSVSEGGLVKYTLKLTKDGSEYVTKNGALRRLNEYLSQNFCSEFVGSTEIMEKTEDVSLLTEEVFENELQKIEYRTIKVLEPIVIDDLTMGDSALYIEDCVENGEYTVCGRITEITEKMTKKDKPFLIIRIDDTTGKLSGVYFSKKGTYGHIKALQVGDAIIARGSIGDYNGKKSFTFDKINRCKFPDDFKKKEKAKKRAPREYKTVFPFKAETVKVKSVFDKEENLPEILTEKTFVVFDIETTGLEVSENGITEIGAVKIEGGKISEEWTTLVCPEYPISKENFAITGISEEMVKDAPAISKVLPDFLKFISGATVVAHNAEFDTKFIKKYANQEEYIFDNEIMDTMLLAREYLPELRRADLHTVAEHFGIVFHHHRALSDAYATAEAFIELMKIKSKV